jgi:3-methyladenine DNA glycosylase AlkC
MQELEEFTMAEEEAQNTAKKDAAAEESRVQDQILEAIKRSQDATLKIVSAWSESVAKLTPQLPEMPKMPMFDALPKPDEVSDKYFEFAQELMNAQQEFVKRLIAALPGHDEPSA